MTTLQDFLDNALNEGKSRNVPQPEDCRNLPVESIVAAITTQVNIYRDNGNTNNKQFYAGICKDVQENMQRHGNDYYVSLCDCGSREKSGKVEAELEKLGFDVGTRANNGGDDETTIVYVIKKDRNFTP